MGKPRPLTSCAYTSCALKNYSQGKCYSLKDAYIQGVNSHFQIQENGKKSLEGKGRINN